MNRTDKVLRMVRVFLPFYLLTLLPFTALAQESQEVYSFLRLPVSAHVAALGGDNITLSDDDATVIFHNPALISNVTDKSLNLNFMTYMEGAKTASASFVKAYKERGTWGVSAQYMDYGSMKETTVDNSEMGTFSARDIALAGSFAYLLSNRISGGITARFITSHIASHNSAAVAVDLGINYFDTANVYQMGSSEEITGRLVRDFGLDRDEIVVATKVHFDMRPGRPNGGGSSRKNILAEIDHSLKRLDMDYVDLYQIHRLDANTPMEEIMEALHDVVKSGKARYIGASTIFAWQLERMQQIAERNGWTKFVSLQPQYNLIYREEEREILPLCRDRKMAVVPWSPLAGGRCAHPWGTKTARNAIDEVSPMVWGATDAQDKVVVDNLEKIAAAHGRTMAQESLAWMLSKPGITAPIVGSTAVRHIEEAVSALDITLDPEEIAALEAPYVPHIKTGAF